MAPSMTPLMTPFRRLASLTLVALFVAACSGGTAASATPEATEAATEAPASAAPSAAAGTCAGVPTVAAGTLTIGTDNPAYPPYFEPSETQNGDWELGDPENGKGFEAAFAYALADRMGYAKEAVAWTVVPFDTSYAPGPKQFDVDINQVSYSAKRAEAVDMSDGYYFVNQAVVAMKGTPAEKAASIADLKALKLGAMVGTTSYSTITDVIAPTTEAMVYNTNDLAIQALQNGQIDAIVVDLPTAFYITAAQIVDADFNPLASIVGQFPTQSGADAEHFSVVLAKGSPLTACVNQAIAELTADGTLAAITQEWLADKANAPVLK